MRREVTQRVTILEIGRKPEYYSASPLMRRGCGAADATPALAHDRAAQRPDAFHRAEAESEQNFNYGSQNRNAQTERACVVSVPSLALYDGPPYLK